MARIRSIKPDFWTDGKVIGLDPWARLLFIGMWNFALCDAGHLPDDPLGLKLKVLPADPVDPDKLVDDIVSTGMVARLTLPDGRVFLHVRRLSEHQKVDGRWTPRCPVCSHEASPNPTETRGSFGELPETHPSSTPEGKGKERKGREDVGERLDVERLCTLLVELMVGNGCRRPRITQKWRDEARLLLDVDKVPLAKAESLLRWAQANGFWKSNIKSMPKFREQYDTLRLQALDEWERANGKGTPGPRAVPDLKPPAEGELPVVVGDPFAGTGGAA